MENQIVIFLKRMPFMIFKNRILVSLVIVGLFLSISNQANAKITQNIFKTHSHQIDFQKELKTSQTNFLFVRLLDNSKSANKDIEKLKRKPFNKKVYRKIKRFLKKKKIRRKRRIIAEVSISNLPKNHIS